MNKKLINELAGECLKREHREFALANDIHILLPESASLLKTLVHIAQPKSILEIGTAIGYSGSLMLKCAKNAHLTTIENHEPTLDLAREFFALHGVQDRVNSILGDAMEVVPTLTTTFDFIFLDGPKSKYIDFLPHLLRLLNEGGVLVADNVLFKGYISGQTPPPKHKHNTIIRKMNLFLREISSNPSLSTTVLEAGDGVSVSVKLAS